MTRKDFEAIATAIRAFDPHHGADSNNLFEAGWSAGARDAARAIANVLENSNPNFDHARFLKACGID